MPYEEAALLVGDIPAWLIRLSAVLFGALWGSFFNVAIYRWPRDMSVVSPPSHCPACGAAVPWYRNLPIVAFVMQRGRAACCGAKMTPRYLLVEALGGLLCLVVFEVFVVRAPTADPLNPHALSALLYFAFVGGLLVATFTDLEWMIIPDEVSLGGAALGFATLGFRPELDPIDAGLGAGAGYLFVMVLAVWSYERIFGRRGMGEGDAKLLLFIGAFTGWKGALFSVVAGSFQGVLAAIVGYVSGRGVGASVDRSHEEGPTNESSEASASCVDVQGDAVELVEPPHLDPSERPAGGADGGPEADDGLDADDAASDDAGFRMRIPFGPFLALGAVEWLFFGPRIVDGYFSLMDWLLG